MGKGPEKAVAARLNELALTYEPPDFDHVPSPEAALLLSAIDHSSGYERSHRVDGEGPFSGSALVWELACAAERHEPGTLGAANAARIDGDGIARMLSVDGDTVSDPATRARLWNQIGSVLVSDHAGSAQALLNSCGRRLSGPGGLLQRLSRFEAFSDPLAKKSFLVAKICERRGWLQIDDPESWQVSADNILMRLALRSGLIPPGPLDQVRAATRAAFKRQSELTGIPPTVLDDLLWERGRLDADLLGRGGGDLHEPPRRVGVHFY